MASGLAPMTTVLRWLPRHRQLGVVSQVAWELGASANGVKLCYLGANVDGAKTLSLFFKIFPPKTYLRESFEKRVKNKKKTTRLARSWLYKRHVLGSIPPVDPGCFNSGFYSSVAYGALLVSVILRTRFSDLCVVVGLVVYVWRQYGVCG
jgi:hypothetical protein